MGINTHHDRNARGHRAGRRAALVLVAAVGLAACGGDDESAATETAFDISPVAETAAGDQSVAIGADTAEAAESGAGAAPGSIDLGTIGRDVIVEMRVVVSTDDVQRSVSAVSARASALGGGVASSEVDFGDTATGERNGYAVLVVKVPPGAVDALIAALDDTGTVQSLNQSAQDVTDQLVDLDVRIENARASVANVREFMDRTENLSELVTLEAELTRRQTELEQLEAQQRNLSERVALATVTIEIVPTESVPEVVPDGGIGDAFEDGLRAFAAVVYGIVIVLAVLAPFLVAGALAGGLVWLIVRRSSRRAPTPHAAPGRLGPESAPSAAPVNSSAPVSEDVDVPTPTG